MWELLASVNRLLAVYGRPVYMTSGYRPGYYNESVGGAPNSTHLMCQGIDLLDETKELSEWMLSNLNELEKNGLYMESPDYTPKHVHLQTRPTRNRVFIP